MSDQQLPLQDLHHASEPAPVLTPSESAPVAPNDPVFVQPVPAPASSILRQFMIGALIIIAVILIGGVGTIAYGAYRLGWKGSLTKVVLRAVPLPIAVVNGERISFAEYLQDVDSLTTFYKSPAAPQGQTPTSSEVQKSVLDRMIQNALLTQETEKKRIKVGSDEVETEFQKLVTQSGGVSNVEQQLKNLYNWTPSQFKEKVLRPYLLQQKLGAAITEDTSADAALKARAQVVLDKLKAGAKFEDMAKQFSEDPSNATKGGDLGSFGKGVMVKAFEDVAFGLKAGETSGLVKTQFGYHIIRVDSIDTKKGQITARHILLRAPDVETYLAQVKAKANISLYVK